jgi:hypothetical protein
MNAMSACDKSPPSAVSSSAGASDPAGDLDGHLDADPLYVNAFASNRVAARRLSCMFGVLSARKVHHSRSVAIGVGVRLRAYGVGEERAGSRVAFARGAAGRPE